MKHKIFHWHKIFCAISLIILAGLAENVKGQFVPFQSAQYKHLAADTLYNLTGNGEPLTQPNSYKRIVWYYDSTADAHWYWKPQDQEWAEFSGGGGGSTNSNIGSGYRWAVPNTNDIKTAFAGYAILIDSTSNTNGLTFIVDSATLSTKYFTSLSATSPITYSGGINGIISTSMSTNKLIGRYSSGTGVMEEVTIGSGLSLDGSGNLTATGSGGSVTSVGLAAPSIFTVSGSPVTTSGTLTFTPNNATGDIIYGSGTNTLAYRAIGTTGQHLVVSGGLPVWRDTTAVPTSYVSSWSAGTTGFTPSTATTGAVTLAGVLVEANGGTHQSTYATGDLLYASATNTLSKLAIGTTGQKLVVVGGVPVWRDTTASFGGYSFTNGLTLTGTTAKWGGTLVNNTTITGGGFYSAFSGGRLEAGQGAAVTAANDLTLGNDGNTFSITGATQINAITTTNWQAGSVINLVFASTPTVKHNTAGGAGTAVILLASSADFVAAANDVLTLVYDGTSWHETSRKQAATGGQFWALATGGTMTGVNTLTQNRENGFLWNGGYTETGQGKYYAQYNPTITTRPTAGDTTYGLVIHPITLNQGTSGTQYNVALDIDVVLGTTAGAARNQMAIQFKGDINPKTTNAYTLGTLGGPIMNAVVSNTTYSNFFRANTTTDNITWGSSTLSTMRLFSANSAVPGLQLNTHGNLTATSNNVMFESVGGFKFWGGGVVTTIATPIKPTLVVGGTPGTTHIVYQWVARMANGGTTDAGPADSVTTANATLSSTNKVTITLGTEVQGAAFYDLYVTRTDGSATLGKIGTVTSANNNSSISLTHVSNSAGDLATPPSLNTTGRVGIGTSTPAGILDLTSTTLPFYPPRMTTTQRNLMTGLTEGAIIWNTTTTQLNYYNGAAWVTTGPVSAQVTGSNVTTTVTTAADVTGLTVAVGANKKYRVTATLFIGCDNTGGMQFGLNGPAGSAILSGVWAGSSATANGSMQSRLAAIGSLTSATAFNRFNGATGMITLIGYVTTTGTAGNITIQFASGTSTQTSTVFIGSTMDLTEIQ